MSHLSRLISILTLLKSKRLLTAPELAEKYDVSVRTIYRDIRKLEESGVPIITVEGRGYSLMEGYSVAPVQFTEKQANALITAENIVKKSQDVSFLQDFEEAMTKIRSVFRHSVLTKGEMLDSKIYVLGKREEELASSALSEIQVAITNFNFMEINYRKVDNSEPTFRKVEPQAVVATQYKWILIAWCHLRNDYRAFRIDRILNFRVLQEHFEDRNFVLQKYFAEHPYGGKKL